MWDMLAWIVLTRTITIRLPTDMLVSDLSEYHSTFWRCWGEEMGEEMREEDTVEPLIRDPPR